KSRLRTRKEQGVLSAFSKEISMGTVTQSIHVTRTTAGMPLRLLYGGRSYTVTAEPQRGYARRRWWAEEHRAEIGSGAGLVDYQVRRVQVKPARSADRPIL